MGNSGHCFFQKNGKIKPTRCITTAVIHKLTGILSSEFRRLPLVPPVEWPSVIAGFVSEFGELTALLGPLWLSLSLLEEPDASELLPRNVCLKPSNNVRFGFGDPRTEAMATLPMRPDCKKSGDIESLPGELTGPGDLDLEVFDELCFLPRDGVDDFCSPLNFTLPVSSCRLAMSGDDLSRKQLQKGNTLRWKDKGALHGANPLVQQSCPNLQWISARSCLTIQILLVNHHYMWEEIALKWTVNAHRSNFYVEYAKFWIATTLQLF